MIQCLTTNQIFKEQTRFDSGSGKHLKRDAFVNLEWWSQSGSNRRPSACKADALPAELWPR
jgi:hypothetical protein